MEKFAGLILLLIEATQAGDLSLFGHDAAHTGVAGQAYNSFRDENCCIGG